MSLQENLADYIQTLMKRNHKSLTEFSAELGISRNSLYGYSTGRGNPTIATLEYLAEQLGVDPAVLLLGILDQDYRRAALPLLDTLRGISDLDEEKRLRFAELFVELIRLWGGE